MRFIGCNCGNALGERCLEPSNPMGAHDSSFEVLWLPGTAGHLCHVLGRGVRKLAGWTRYFIDPNGDGVRCRVGQNAQQGCFEAVFFDSCEGSFWRRGVDRWVVWEHGSVAGA